MIINAANRKMKNSQNVHKNTHKKIDYFDEKMKEFEN